MALDIGVNYGECFLSTIYSPETKILAIEANPYLVPYLNKSIHAHPSRNQMSVINALATDTPQEHTEFFINNDWSGGSTAIESIAQDDSSNTERVGTKSIRIDNLVTDNDINTSCIVFKLDVEG
ncbi:FkbM family methyltransferase [Solemya velesiana gill symbiont]|uniref:Methyltransferase FkbM domain-containing protein n=1 Tax=Solemya velesiana gill symbiont TaxID=1918948 RepID=A0A1T2KY77_9GAMM|nr:FkbM family methyltransferase [Solemya velesiana gill symbiont]OOZ37676.1 hypothetical protein BOW51_01445 [Solemya velesiana gill symbiont]